MESSNQTQSQNAGETTEKKNGEVLIRLEGIKKVFITDEVETHALTGIHLDIHKGEYISIAGRRGVANPRCSRYSAYSTRRPRAPTC